MADPSSTRSSGNPKGDIGKIEINAVGNEFGAIYDGVRSDMEDKSPTYLLPSSILPMTAQEMAAWKVYKICPQKTVEDEWEAVKTIIANKMIQELHAYSGREQQKRGTVLSNVQLFVFGETLPRGHGHRGRISALMSLLFDEITGRTPRKRRTPTSTQVRPVKIPRLLVPHSLFVGVIGDSPLAKVLVQRLLVCNYHVITSSQTVYDQVYNDPLPVHLSSPLTLDLAASLSSLVDSSEVIIVVTASLVSAETLYFHTEGFLELMKPTKVLYDMTIEDYNLSSRIHAECDKRAIRFYDCPMFPVPNSTLSYDLAPPSLFLGGKVLPEDFSMNVLYSLGAAIYPCRPNYGIVYKRLVSHYYCLQTQVMNEMSTVAQSFGVTDDKALAHMLAMNANPQMIMLRDKTYSTRDLKEQKALKIPLDSLITPMKQLYSLPSTHLPFTTVLCNLVDSYSDISRLDDKDVSLLWKTMQKDSFSTLNDLSVL